MIGLLGRKVSVLWFCLYIKYIVYKQLELEALVYQPLFPGEVSQVPLYFLLLVLELSTATECVRDGTYFNLMKIIVPASASGRIGLLALILGSYPIIKWRICCLESWGITQYLSQYHTCRWFYMINWYICFSETLDFSWCWVANWNWKLLIHFLGKLFSWFSLALLLLWCWSEEEW